MDKEELKEAIDKGAKEAAHLLSPEDTEFLKSIFYKTIIERKTMKEAIGMSDDFLEALYGQAYSCFQSGKFDDAYSLFVALASFDPNQAKFPMGKALCLVQKKEWEKALYYFLVATNLDRKNPMALFQASDCLIKLDRKKEAIEQLKNVIVVASENPKYASLVGKATMEIQSLENDLAGKPTVVPIVAEEKATINAGQMQEKVTS